MQNLLNSNKPPVSSKITERHNLGGHIGGHKTHLDIVRLPRSCFPEGCVPFLGRCTKIDVSPRRDS
jgi:hypothetical protein